MHNAIPPGAELETEGFMRYVVLVKSNTKWELHHLSSSIYIAFNVIDMLIDDDYLYDSGSGTQAIVVEEDLYYSGKMQPLKRPKDFKEWKARHDALPVRAVESLRSQAVTAAPAPIQAAKVCGRRLTAVRKLSLASWFKEEPAQNFERLREVTVDPVPSQAPQASEERPVVDCICKRPLASWFK